MPAGTAATTKRLEPERVPRFVPRKPRLVLGMKPRVVPGMESWRTCLQACKGIIRRVFGKTCSTT